MDFSVLLIGIITISALVLPFVFSYRSDARKAKKNYILFSQLAAEKSLAITQVDVLTNGIIGIDNDKNKLGFAPLDLSFFKIIELEKVDKCRLRNNSRTVGTKANAYTVTESIELEFNFINKKEQVYSINFYDASKNFQLRGELQLAEKWQKIISRQLSEKIEYINGSLV